MKDGTRTPLRVVAYHCLQCWGWNRRGRHVMVVRRGG